MEYNYVYSGDTVIAITNGNGSPVLKFICDENGDYIGFTYGTGTYYYIRNLQNDVVAIVDANQNVLVTYSYDPWGNVTVLGKFASTIGDINPIRYRGYFYDSETELYYLQSRYYDPETCRFINADEASVVTVSPDSANYDKNLYAYCDNNPVVRADSSGCLWHLAVGAVVGLASQYIADVAFNLIEKKPFSEVFKPTSTIADYGAAALSGALAASGVGLGASIGINAAIGGANYIANCAIEGEDVNGKDFFLATGASALSSLIGGKGADGAKLRGIVKTSKETLKTAVSPNKIALYTSKIANVKKTVLKSTVRTIAAGLATNGFNYVRKLVTNSDV